jgi:hypothetical protein
VVKVVLPYLKDLKEIQGKTEHLGLKGFKGLQEKLLILDG